MPYKDKQKQNEYMKAWIAQRRIDFFEGKSCVACGSIERLELDHIDPSEKEDHRIWSWSEKRRLAEIAKCQILCESCHAIKTASENSKPLIHGTHERGYLRGCKCNDCTTAHRFYNRSWRSAANR